jgi:hypothetical protein
VTLRRLAAALLLFLLAAAALPAAEGQATLEDKVKTAFLYKFTRYVQWPPPAAEEFRIAVIGESGVLAPLRELAAEKLVDGARIRVYQPRSIDEIGRCRILFIPRSEAERLPAILKAASGKGILTVGDGPGFAARGVAINFVVVEGKLRPGWRSARSC